MRKMYTEGIVMPRLWENPGRIHLEALVSSIEDLQFYCKLFAERRASKTNRVLTESDRIIVDAIWPTSEKAKDSGIDP